MDSQEAYLHYDDVIWVSYLVVDQV